MGTQYHTHMSTLVIAVAALKGGVGKTTMAINLGTCFHRAGHRTLLIDTDPQSTCRIWSEKGSDANYDGPPVVSVSGKSLRKDLAAISHGFDVVIIDTPPRMAVEARAAMMVADFVLMPITPGAADVWALQETVDVLDDARSMRPDIRSAIVFNRRDRTVLSRMAFTAVEEMNLPIFETAFGNRVAFGESVLAGQGVIDYEPESTAAIEATALAKEIVEVIAA